MLRSKPKPKKSGALKFDWKEKEKSLGVVIRALDELKHAYPEVKKTDEFVEIEHLRDGFVKVWNKLKKLTIRE